MYKRDEEIYIYLYTYIYIYAYIYIYVRCTSHAALCRTRVLRTALCTARIYKIIKKEKREKRDTTRDCKVRVVQVCTGEQSYVQIG